MLMFSRAKMTITGNGRYYFFSQLKNAKKLKMAMTEPSLPSNRWLLLSNKPLREQDLTMYQARKVYYRLSNIIDLSVWLKRKREETGYQTA